MKMFIKEPGTCDWINTQVETGDVFYDIGANIGVYTVLAAQRVGASGKVFAFEPHSATFARLLETISINSLSEIVTPCNFALHERKGFFPYCYSSPEAGSSQSQLMPQHLHRQVRNPSDVVELKFSASLDSLIAAGGFAPADHVKIDVDGNELMILRGMRALLSGSRPPKSVQVEINPDQRAGALMTLVTFIKVQRKAVFGALPARLAGAREVPASMYLPVLGLVGLCLLSGLLWPLGVDGVVGAAAGAVRSPSGERSAATAYVERIHGEQPR